MILSRLGKTGKRASLSKGPGLANLGLAIGYFLLVATILALSGYSIMAESAVSAEFGSDWSSSDDDEKRTILFLGNSLSAGYGLDPDQSFPALIQQKIDSLKWPYHIINAGLTGDTSAGGVRRIKWLLRQQIDFLVLELGGNDGLRGIALAETGKNLQTIVDLTKKAFPDCRIVIAGMQVPPNMGERYAKGFRRLFVDLAENNKADLIPFLLEGVGGIPRLNMPDRVHPTAEGYRIVAQNVWTVLMPILSEQLPKVKIKK